MKRKLKLINFSLVLSTIIFIPSFVVFLEPIVNKRLAHDSAPWFIIRDEEGDLLAIETVHENIFDVFLFALRYNAPGQIVGEIVSYDNAWGFRFDPFTVRFYFIDNMTSPYSQPISEITKNLPGYFNQNRWFYGSVVSVFYNYFPLRVLALIFSIIGFLCLVPTICWQIILLKRKH
ncbi:MAG: hypothetical protein FK733_04390 [Asgard group archaeon]|nr:hypothetical protein [Asgard group archaeon]